MLFSFFSLLIFQGFQIFLNDLLSTDIYLGIQGTFCLCRENNFADTQFGLISTVKKLQVFDYGFWEVCKNSTKIHNYSLSDLIFSCQNASLVFVSQNVDIKILRHGV